MGRTDTGGMVYLVLAGWVVLSIVIAAAHHRLRRLEPGLPPEVEEFLVRFETSLAARHPQVQYLGLVPGQFSGLLRVHGQETPVDLGEIFRRSMAFPDAFDATVDRLVADVTEQGLEQPADHDFGMVAPAILPQVRARSWLEAQGRFGDGGLVHRMLSDDLAVVYVVDRDASMVFVCQAHLRQWRKSETDIHNLAVANLHRVGGKELQGAGTAEEPLIVNLGDGYDAARVLLLEQAEGLLVAIPDRDTLWLGQEQGQDLASLMATTQDLSRRSSHPVSGNLYRVKGGRLEPVEA